MIKYFSYESHKIGGKFITRNEKILDKKPKTSDYSYRIDNRTDYFIYQIDVKKYIERYGEFDKTFQQVYDKLLLQQRNKKLDTL